MPRVLRHREGGFVLRAIVIPDTQAAPGRTTKHLVALSRYIAAKQFDLIVHIGDLCDFPSLSSYDKGKAVFEGRRLAKDWESFQTTVDCIEGAWTGKKYNPRRIYCEGNHEARVQRAENTSPELIGSLPNPCAYMTERGWESYPFLTVAKAEGVLFSHLFPKTLTGRVTNTSIKYGANSANHQIRANMKSCVAGHRPGIDIAMMPGATGMLVGVIAGSFYPWKETYNGPTGDEAWRGVVVLNRLKNGQYDPCLVSLQYLMESFG